MIGALISLWPFEGGEVPYLPVDLDGKRKAHGIERALGLPRHAVAGGLNDLWEVVWRDKRDSVDDLALDEAFGPDPRIRPALVARDFLEPVEGRWRVRGAAKWLFGLEGKSRGGKAAKGNLVPGPKPRGSADVVPDPKPIPSASAEDQPKPPLGTLSALTPSIPTPSTQKPLTTLSDSSDRLALAGMQVDQVLIGAEADRRGPDRPFSDAPDVRAVFDHWVQRTGRSTRTVLSDKRRDRVRARLKQGFTVQDLKQAIDGCAQTPHNQGQNDRGETYDDLELICRDPEHVEKFMRNAKAPPKPPPKSTNGRATDADKDWSGFAPSDDTDELFEGTG